MEKGVGVVSVEEAWCSVLEVGCWAATVGECTWQGHSACDTRFLHECRTFNIQLWTIYLNLCISPIHPRGHIHTIHVCIHTRAHMHTHALTHAHTHARTHTYTVPLLPSHSCDWVDALKSALCHLHSALCTLHLSSQQLTLLRVSVPRQGSIRGAEREEEGRRRNF